MIKPMAIVPLAGGARLSLQAIQHEFVSAWPRLPRPIDSKRTEHALSFSVGGSSAIFDLMPGPIAAPDFAPTCAASWLWPNAADAVAQQRGHVVITLDSKETALNQIKFLSLATTALLLACPGGLGVYWCGGPVVTSSELFREFCLKMLPDSLPLYIWVDFRTARQPDGRSVGHTSGMSQFGLMEIETLTSHEDPEKLRERIFSLAVFLVENGQVIKNGDLLDETGPEPIRVVFSDSAFGRTRKVMRLDFERAG
jgi:hypothetical protein